VHALGLLLLPGGRIEAYLLDWLNLLLRWAHVIVGIAWIGASFYFIWLDNHLESAKDPALAGELWAIHGGGFYRVEKYRLAPPQLPRLLHWFKWEAYWTWLTGLALLVAMYYANAELYLIDPAVMPLSKWAAIGIGVGFLVLSYSIYEGLCRSLRDTALSIVLFALLALAAWGLAQVFGARGAFIHYGAMLGTIMVANVAHIIIPGQRRMVTAMSEGRSPDANDAAMGKQRSVHNTYFTLPAVFTMISAHYPMTWHWGALVALTLAGAMVRVWFVMRHKGRAPLWVLLLGMAFLIGTALLLKPRGEEAGPRVSLEDVKRVIDARCLSCHAEKPTFHGLAEAPKGVKLDTVDRVQAQRAQIGQQVRSRAMPPGNLTALSDSERLLLDRWAAMK
jgi:uncharacterized membrane protein